MEANWELGEVWIRQIEQDYLAGKYEKLLTDMKECYETALRSGELNHTNTTPVAKLQDEETLEQKRERKEQRKQMYEKLRQLAETVPELTISRVIKNILPKPPLPIEIEPSTPELVKISSEYSDKQMLLWRGVLGSGVDKETFSAILFLEELIKRSHLQKVLFDREEWRHSMANVHDFTYFNSLVSGLRKASNETEEQVIKIFQAII